MTPSNFASKLNWRLVFVHFIASLFFVHAFHSFSYLSYVNLTDILRHSYGQPAENIFKEHQFNVTDLSYYSLWIGISGFIGLFIAFIISLVITIKRKWFWVNSIIVFLLSYALYALDFLGMTYVTQFRWHLANLFNDTRMTFLITGIIFLLIGLALFFLKRTNNFIAHKEVHNIQSLHDQ